MDRYSHRGNSNNPPWSMCNCTPVARSLTVFVLLLGVSFYRLILGSFLFSLCHCWTHALVSPEVIAEKPLGTLQIPTSLWSPRYTAQLLASDCSLIASSEHDAACYYCMISGLWLDKTVISNCQRCENTNLEDRYLYTSYLKTPWTKTMLVLIKLSIILHITKYHIGF